ERLCAWLPSKGTGLAFDIGIEMAPDGQGMDHHIATARRFNLLFLFLLAALLPTAVLAQVPTGTIGGRVTDAQDRSIPGVTVTVSSPALQGVRTTVTTVNGDY